uniref:Uncharacterized protein n=1 Tax=Rhizophora mucronata TaxID=61149 RepID=A0A2P2NNS9_RHIMU
MALLIYPYKTRITEWSILDHLLSCKFITLTPVGTIQLSR